VQVPSNNYTTLPTTLQGLYKVEAAKTQVYLNGRKLVYIDDQTADYEVDYAYVVGDNTQVTLTLAKGASEGDVLDVTFWPSYLDTEGILQPGYVLQNIDYAFWSQDEATSNISFLHGNVGIGTADPAVSLDIRTTDAVRLPSGTTAERPEVDGQGYIRYNTETWQFEGLVAANQWGSLGGVKSVDQFTYITAENDSNLRFFTGAAQRMIITSNGDVGIGTHQPFAKMHVEGDVKATSFIGSGALLTSLPAGQLTDTVAVNKGGTGVTNLSINKVLVGNDTSGIVAPNLLHWNNSTSRLGIGTATPSQTLHVQGDILSTGTITASNLSIIGEFTTLNTATSNTDQVVVTNHGTGPALKVTQTGNSTLAEFYDNETGIALMIANDGLVGIGTADPQYKLDVDGTIYASGDVIAFSDSRKKKNVEVIPCALDKVLRIRGVTFEKSDGTEENQRRHAGVIAQEVEEVLPEVVYTAADGTKSVAYGNLIGLLIEAVKELAARK
jgi:hypothetical protein